MASSAAISLTPESPLKNAPAGRPDAIHASASAVAAVMTAVAARPLGTSP